MAQANDYAQLGGIFKDVWGDSILDPFKFLTPLINDLPLEAPASHAGGKYHQPIMLQYENGITHAAPQTVPGYGSVTYIAPNAGAVPDAEIEGAQLYGRSIVAYEAMMRSLQNFNSSEEDKKKAVKGATKTVMNSLGRSLAKRCEIFAIHGAQPNGLGVIESISSSAAATYGGTAGFHIDVSISPLEWSRGIWAMGVGATFDIYTLPAAGATTSGTRQNSATNTHVGNSQVGLILTAINPTASLTGGTLDGNETGRVLRFFHTTQGATGAEACAVGRAIFFESGGPATTTSGGVISVGKEMMGLDMLANVAATVCFTGFGNYGSELYGLSAATYDMWQGNRVDSVGNMKLAQMLEYATAIVDFGVMGQRVRCVAPTKLFQQFASDEAALRRYNGSSKEAKNGFSMLEFHMTGGNTLEVLGHPFQKDGKAHLYPVDELHRVGPQDISFLTRKGELALEVSSAAAAELRAAGEFNLYADTNKHLISINGITY